MEAEKKSREKKPAGKRRSEKKLKILFAASEAVPFAKTGGLADVAGALPKALREMGHDVRLVMPGYSSISKEKFNIKPTGKKVTVDIALTEHVGEIYETTIPDTDIPVYFIQSGSFFDREELYRTPQGEYWDNAERFMFFSRAAVEMMKTVGFQPDVVNCSDWHTGLVPVYLKTIYSGDKFYSSIKTVYSIHNIAYQGVFGKDKLSHAGFGWELYNPEQLEFYGGINYMKGGMVFSDVINTVSERYKEEIQTGEYGYGLDGVLRARSSDLRGILNGIDYTQWDPRTDKLLDVNYGPQNMEKKTELKKKLLAAAGLDYYENIPLIGLVTRLDDQKGLDFIAAIIDEMMKFNIQFIVLGTGEERYHNMFYEMKDRYPEKIGVNIKFDNRIAHNIYGGSDMFLMPSRFEPCGLGQLISLKYGTVPIVRETGGLADTVAQYNFKTKQGNGFVFKGYNPWELMQTIRIAVDAYKNKTVWKRIVSNGMKQNFSWDEAAKKYVEMYKDIIKKTTNKN
ncbi:MAG: glycogen synthase GlgA [Candidatus Goldiibacteriota bacterium]